MIELNKTKMFKNISIELQEITPDYMPAHTGKYLVRTISTGPLKMISYLEARVAKTYHDDKNKWTYSIDINNQVATHISKEVLK